MAHYNFNTKINTLHAILSELYDENEYVVKIERVYSFGYKQVIVVSDTTWEIYHSDFTFSSYRLVDGREGKTWRLYDEGKWAIENNNVIKKPRKYDTRN